LSPARTATQRFSPNLAVCRSGPFRVDPARASRFAVTCHLVDGPPASMTERRACLGTTRVVRRQIGRRWIALERTSPSAPPEAPERLTVNQLIPPRQLHGLSGGGGDASWPRLVNLRAFCCSSPANAVVRRGTREGSVRGQLVVDPGFSVCTAAERGLALRCISRDRPLALQEIAEVE